MSWLEMLQNNALAKEDVRDCVLADEFLRLAVGMAGIDWCIERLQQIKDSDAEPKTMLDVILGTGPSKG